MTNEELEQQLKQQEAEFFARLDAEFPYMTDEAAEVVINSLKSVDQQIGEMTRQQRVAQSSLEYAERQLKEEMAQAERTKKYAERGRQLQEAEDMLRNERDKWNLGR